MPMFKIFMIFKNKILSSSSSKASESLINSSYYSFLALFTYYFLHKMMSHIRFTFPYLYRRCWLHMGRIALLSPAVIALMLSHLSCYKMSYDSLWSSILCDVSGPIVYRCWGLSKVKIRWGRWLPSWFGDGSCSNQLRTGSEESTPPGQHVQPRVQYGMAC
jgi:hypothetical protein